MSIYKGYKRPKALFKGNKFVERLQVGGNPIIYHKTNQLSPAFHVHSTYPLGNVGLVVDASSFSISGNPSSQEYRNCIIESNEYIYKFSFKLDNSVQQSSSQDPAYNITIYGLKDFIWNSENEDWEEDDVALVNLYTKPFNGRFKCHVVFNVGETRNEADFPENVPGWDTILDGTDTINIVYVKQGTTIIDTYVPPKTWCVYYTTTNNKVIPSFSTGRMDYVPAYAQVIMTLQYQGSSNKRKVTITDTDVIHGYREID